MGKWFIFQVKPRHVTPQINCLRIMSPVLTVSTHISGISKEIDGKTFIFRVNLGMWPLKSDNLRKMSPVLMVTTHISGISKEIDGKTFIFRVNLRHVTAQIDCLRKTSPVSEGFNTHLWGCSGDGWENIHFQVNQGMWPLKSIVSEKRALFWWFQHTFLMFLKEIDGKMMHFSSKPRHVTPQINRLGKMSSILMVSTYIYSVAQRR